MIVLGLRPPRDPRDAARDLIDSLGGRDFYVASPRAVAGRKHAALALRRAVRAFSEGRNIARRVHVEALLYLVGTRNIQRAMELAAVREGDPGLVLVSESDPELGWEEDPSLVGGAFDRDLFGVPEGEDPELWMIEAGALLELEKD